MDQRVETLESQIESISDEIFDIKPIIDEYRKLYPAPNRPIWHLVQDIQQQAMVYMNIIDQLKSGKDAHEIKKRFEVELGLVPSGTLPNPSGPELLTTAFNKISKYRNALVAIIRQHGGELLNELSFSLELTVSVGVSIGFPPAVTFAVEHTAKVETSKKF